MHLALSNSDMQHCDDGLRNWISQQFGPKYRNLVFAGKNKSSARYSQCKVAQEPYKGPFLNEKNAERTPIESNGFLAFTQF